jgi:hypothetical protein
MVGSGVAMIVVENATVDHPCGSGSNWTLRADTDDTQANEPDKTVIWLVL